jgi:hypothetical protein
MLRPASRVINERFGIPPTVVANRTAFQLIERSNAGIAINFSNDRMLEYGTRRLGVIADFARNRTILVP